MLKLIIFAGLALYARAQTAPPKKYTVNLDLPPEKRWQDVVLDNKIIVKDVHEVLK